MPLTLINRWTSDTRGSVSILAALSMTTMLTAAGAAIEMQSVSNHRSKLQSAADAAALSVVRKAVDDGVLRPDVLRSTGAQTFRDNLSTDLAQRSTVRIDVTGSARSPESTVQFSMSVPTRFGGFIGMSAINVSGVATASMNASGWVDLIFAIDISASMGLGATTTAQQDLQNATGCMFACHMDEAGGAETGLAAARRLGIPLRLDVVKTASRNLIDQAATEVGASRVRSSLYTFHHTARLAAALSTHLADVKAGIADAEIADRSTARTSVPGSPGDTVPQNIFDLLNRDVTGRGEGTASSPQKLVVLLTDGVEGTWAPYLETRVFDPTRCQALKDRGVTLAVVYAKYNYLNKDADATYQWAVKPFVDQIEPNLRACASPGLFAAGDTPAEIDAAFRSVWASFRGSYLKLTR